MSNFLSASYDNINKFRTDGVSPGNKFESFSGSIYALAIVPYSEGKLNILVR